MAHRKKKHTFILPQTDTANTYKSWMAILDELLEFESVG